MPVEKVPIVHKFGIISHSQRLELQERLLKQSYLQTYGSRKAQLSSRNPLEVTEDFVQQFNSAESLDEQEKLEAVAHKMLERIKRRAGLKTGGAKNDDLPVAWTELSQLAQCNGKIQEECLNVLITSLDQAPLSASNIPALFYLAETTLYWLRTDAVHQPYLRTGEIKLLRMGQLVFVRLFFHHMTGQLQGHEEFKNRLYTYLDGFTDCQEAYSPYPNALLAIRYISEVGKITIGDSNTEAGEIKEGDNVAALHTEPEPLQELETEATSSVAVESATAAEQLGASELDADMFRDASANYDDQESSHSGAISSSVHDLSPTLWHALDVWRCVNHLGGGLADALRALAHCGMGLGLENWVDGLCAAQVLADAARANLSVLKVLQNLARGISPRPATPSKPPKAQNVNNDPRTSASTSKLTSKFTFNSDIREDFEQDFTETAKAKAPQQNVNDAKAGHDTVKRDLTFCSVKHATRSKTMGTENTEKVPNTARQAEAGSDLPASGRASQASTVMTYTNAPSQGTPGLQGWHWEVAITYADIMADICLHGATSAVQKVALVGNNKDISDIHKVTQACCPMKSAGLLDLVHFKAVDEVNDGSSNDWSWRVRYSAMQGLVKICRCCAGDQTKEGMRTVAWNALVNAQSSEKDIRVLEALKVGQVDASIESLLSQTVKEASKSLGSKVAKGLSLLYLPPLPPPVNENQPKPKPRPRNVMTNNPVTPVRKPVRTSLREELLLATTLYQPAVDFNTRTSFDLKRIVEDQWRKDEQQRLEDEEEERQNQLAGRQKQEEESRVKAEESRKAKLSKSQKRTDMVSPSSAHSHKEIVSS